MDAKARLGAEIRRVRELRPKISRQQVADEAVMATGTIRAAENGASIDYTYRVLVEVLARLGRPIDLDALLGPDQVPIGMRPVSWDDGSTAASSEGLSQVDLTVRLVESTLEASPPDERRALSTNLWLLIRGRDAELARRLSAPWDSPPPPADAHPEGGCEGETLFGR
jgi:transcriptional regulator with XRE-family HTH domain